MAREDAPAGHGRELALTGAAAILRHDDAGLWRRFFLPETSRIPALALLAIGLVLGPGYTAPPVRLAWRGWGEINVAITHSINIVLCGRVLQTGAPMAASPGLVSFPMGLAIFASILLAGLQHFEEDRRVDAVHCCLLSLVISSRR